MDLKVQEENNNVTEKKVQEQSRYRNKWYEEFKISYLSVSVLAYLHIAGAHGLYLCFTKAMWKTILFHFICWLMVAKGVIVGAHKLWAHRSFKATRPLEIFLMICHSMAFQFTVYKWVIVHRQHHKYSDTPRDPHDARRGLFFSHMGWMMVKKPGGKWDPQVVASAESLKKNPVVEFQRRHANWLLPFCTFILPSLIPLFWGETFFTAWHVNVCRVILIIHHTATINSIAHKFGHKPYDTRLGAATTWFLVFFTMGEGHHNFHHAFPQDYRSCEKGLAWSNFMSLFVEFCAKFGLAYDLKEAGEEAIRWKKEKRGDGSNFGSKFLVSS